jgi:hypothetical protein
LGVAGDALAESVEGFEFFLGSEEIKKADIEFASVEISGEAQQMELEEPGRILRDGRADAEIRHAGENFFVEKGFDGIDAIGRKLERAGGDVCCGKSDFATEARSAKDGAAD